MQTLDNIYSNYGENIFEEVISIISAAWNGDPVSLSAPMLSGMAIFVKAYSNEYDRSMLIKKLSKVIPQIIISAGKSGVSRSNAKYAREIVAVYNNHLNEKRKLDEKKI